MMDWLGKFLQLPEPFLNCSEGPGGGVIQVKLQFTTVALPTVKQTDFIPFKFFLLNNTQTGFFSACKNSNKALKLNRIFFRNV
jgi:hypothetical protein